MREQPVGVLAFVAAVLVGACGGGDHDAADGSVGAGGDGALSHHDGGSTSHEDAKARGDAKAGGDANAKADAKAGTDAASGGACTAEAVETCSCSAGMGTRRCLADGSAWGSCTCVSYGKEIAVSPTGDDSAAGTLAHPFKTLERAQTAVRALVTSGLPTGGVVVWLRGGLYPRTATFALTASDSGTATAPVVYRGYPGETARVVGGVDLDPTAFKTVTSTSPVWARLDPTAQGKVVSLDLASAGITDFGTLSRRGVFITGVPAALELFIDGARQPLGRWPDADDDDWSALPDVTANQLTLYGTGVVPDVTGVYTKDSVQDGASSFTRQGTVDGKTWHLYRSTGGTGSSTYVAWFLTTSTTGYPTTTDPFWFIYQSTFGALAPAQGAVGDLGFADPDAVIYGFSRIATVPSATSFTLTENRTARWTTAPDAWVHGYFAYTWADDHLPIASVAPSTGTIDITGTPYGNLNASILGSGASPVYAYNLLEEITEPGEWYLDRTSGFLYLWPPANLAQHDLVASVMSTPLVAVTGASNVTLQEITMEATRAQLVEISGTSTNVQVVGCTLRDSGEGAASIADGSNNVFDGDLIHDTGEGGVVVGGGDRPSLTKGANVVQNSDLHDFSQWVWTYTPAVALGGNGNSVLHNVIHGAPHAAIFFYSSSQQSIEYNDISDVMKFSSDVGAIYSWADWGSYGNLVEYNFIHDITSELTGYGVHGVYLDNCLSGPTVASNVLYNFAGSAIFHNGGHDVAMSNNIVANCSAALETTSYCVNNPTSICMGGAADYKAQLDALSYQEDPWASTYPTCAAIPDDCATLTAAGSHWLTPYGTSFTDNVSYGNGSFYLADSPATVADYAAFDDNLDRQDPLFVDEAAENFNLKPGSPALALPGFQPIPFDDIGIQH